MPGATRASFRDEVAASFPKGLALPDEIGRALDWMETEGFVGRYRRSGGRYATLYPVDEAERAGSMVALHTADPGHARAWLRSDDAAILDRLAIFVRTGADGSAAALWLADDSRQSFVHLGSGSGSTVACTLATGPVDFLRFLAIGYLEPCWDEDWHRTPADAHGGNDCAGEAPHRPPTRFRRWVETSFGVSIPATASELVPVAAHLGDTRSDDPFCRWLARLQEW